MRLLLMVVVLLGLVFSLTIGLARQIGLNQPPSSPLRYLRFTDCTLPCWNGILPGQTTLIEATERIQSTFAFPEDTFPAAASAIQIFTTLPLPDFATRLYNVPMSIGVEFNSPQNVIEEIRWVFPLEVSAENIPEIAIGDVVNTFGTPMCVYISDLFSQGWFLIWDTPAGVVEANILGENKLTWMQPIYAITVRTHQFEYGRDACHTDSGNYYPWAGLLSRQHYSRRYG